MPARVTLVGRLEFLEDPGTSREIYLATHPYAGSYADFTDFNFWRLDIKQCRYVGGFGHMSWVTGSGYAEASVDPIAPVAEGVIAHMNDDHADANLTYARALAGLDDATSAIMVGIDRHGITLDVTTPGGPRLARLGFPEPLTSADDARPAVIDLLTLARAAGA